MQDVEYYAFLSDYHLAPAAAFLLPQERHWDFMTELSAAFPHDGMVAQSAKDNLSVTFSLPISPAIKLWEDLAKLEESGDYARVYYQGMQLRVATAHRAATSCTMMARVLSEGCANNCSLGPLHCLPQLLKVAGTPKLTQPIANPPPSVQRPWRANRQEVETALQLPPNNGRLMRWLERETRNFPSSGRPAVFGHVDAPVFSALPSFTFTQRAFHEVCKYEQDALFQSDGSRSRRGTSFWEVDISSASSQPHKAALSARSVNSALGRKVKKEECPNCVVRNTCNLRALHTCNGKLTKEYLLGVLRASIQEHYGGVPSRKAQWVHRHFMLSGMRGFFREEGTTVRPFEVEIMGVFNTLKAAQGLTLRDRSHTNTGRAGTSYARRDATGPWARLTRPSWRHRDAFVVSLKTLKGNYLSDSPSQVSGQEAYDNALDNTFRHDEALQRLRNEEEWLAYWYAQLLPLTGESSFGNWTTSPNGRVEVTSRGFPMSSGWPFITYDLHGLSGDRLQLRWHYNLRRDL